MVHVAVTFRLYLKPQLNLLEKVRCVWNQILIDVQSVKANSKSQSINALQSAHHLKSMSRLGNHSRTAAPCQHNYTLLKNNLLFTLLHYLFFGFAYIKTLLCVLIIVIKHINRIVPSLLAWMFLKLRFNV